MTRRGEAGCPPQPRGPAKRGGRKKVHLHRDSSFHLPVWGAFQMQSACSGEALGGGWREGETTDT